MELEPFLDNIRTGRANFELFKQAYRSFRPTYERAKKIWEFISRDANTVTKFKAKEEIHTLFGYLGIIESLGNALINMIVMLLIANGRDFHIESSHTTPRIKHVYAIEDLERERVPLTTKLNFLRDNGILTLTSIIDSRLRNDIAHLRFDIKENEVFIRGKASRDIVLTHVIMLEHALKIAENSLMQLAEAKGLTPERRNTNA